MFSQKLYYILTFLLLSTAADAGNPCDALTQALNTGIQPSIVDGIDAFFAQIPKPTLQEVIRFADFQADKFKVRNKAYNSGYVLTAQDLIDLFSNVGPVDLYESTVDCFLSFRPSPTLRQVISLANIHTDRFKIRTGAVLKGFVNSPQDFLELYSNVGLVDFDDAGLETFHGFEFAPTDQQVDALINLSFNKSKVIRDAFFRGRLNKHRLEQTGSDIIQNSNPTFKAYIESLGNRIDLAHLDIRKLYQTVPNSENRPGPSGSCRSQELEARLFAVHATSYFPKNGKISVVHPEARAEMSFFRPTTHFSLGDVVRKNRWSWENKVYAVVTPLGDLLPQLVNIDAYDTFILGEFYLTQNSFIVYPMGMDHLLDRKELQSFTYDSNTTTLRTAVRELIYNLGGHPASDV